MNQHQFDSTFVSTSGRISAASVTLQNRPSLEIIHEEQFSDAGSSSRDGKDHDDDRSNSSTPQHINSSRDLDGRITCNETGDSESTAHHISSSTQSGRLSGADAQCGRLSGADVDGASGDEHWSDTNEASYKQDQQKSSNTTRTNSIDMKMLQHCRKLSNSTAVAQQKLAHQVQQHASNTNPGTSMSLAEAKKRLSEGSERNSSPEMQAIKIAEPEADGDTVEVGGAPKTTDISSLNSEERSERSRNNKIQMFASSRDKMSSSSSESLEYVTYGDNYEHQTGGSHGEAARAPGTAGAVPGARITIENDLLSRTSTCQGRRYSDLSCYENKENPRRSTVLLLSSSNTDDDEIIDVESGISDSNLCHASEEKVSRTPPTGGFCKSSEEKANNVNKLPVAKSPVLSQVTSYIGSFFKKGRGSSSSSASCASAASATTSICEVSDSIEASIDLNEIRDRGGVMKNGTMQSSESLVFAEAAQSIEGLEEGNSDIMITPEIDARVGATSSTEVARFSTLSKLSKDQTKTISVSSDRLLTGSKRVPLGLESSIGTVSRTSSMHTFPSNKLELSPKKCNGNTHQQVQTVIMSTDVKGAADGRDGRTSVENLYHGRDWLLDVNNENNGANYRNPPTSEDKICKFHDIEGNSENSKENTTTTRNLVVNSAPIQSMRRGHHDENESYMYSNHNGAAGIDLRGGYHHRGPDIKYYYDDRHNDIDYGIIHGNNSAPIAYNRNSSSINTSSSSSCSTTPESIRKYYDYRVGDEYNTRETLPRKQVNTTNGKGHKNNHHTAGVIEYDRKSGEVQSTYDLQSMEQRRLIYQETLRAFEDQEREFENRYNKAMSKQQRARFFEQNGGTVNLNLQSDFSSNSSGDSGDVYYFGVDQKFPMNVSSIFGPSEKSSISRSRSREDGNLSRVREDSRVNSKRKSTSGSLQKSRQRGRSDNNRDAANDEKSNNVYSNSSSDSRKYYKRCLKLGRSRKYDDHGRREDLAAPRNDGLLLYGNESDIVNGRRDDAYQTRNSKRHGDYGEYDNRSSSSYRPTDKNHAKTKNGPYRNLAGAILLFGMLAFIGLFCHLVLHISGCYNRYNRNNAVTLVPGNTNDLPVTSQETGGSSIFGRQRNTVSSSGAVTANFGNIWNNVCPCLCGGKTSSNGVGNDGGTSVVGSALNTNDSVQQAETNSDYGSIISTTSATGASDDDSASNSLSAAKNAFKRGKASSSSPSRFLAVDAMGSALQNATNYNARNSDSSDGTSSGLGSNFLGARFNNILEKIFDHRAAASSNRRRNNQSRSTTRTRASIVTAAGELV